MDKEQINVRERPLSTDLMAMQAMMHRTLADFLRWSFSSVNYYARGNNEVVTKFRQVVNGLRVSGPTGATSVSVSAGILLQDSTAITPSPGPIDSSFRLAIQRESFSVALPVPVSTTWYLLEAQAEDEVTSSEVRDVMNAGTHLFEATLVAKKSETRVTTRWVAGSSTLIPALSRGDWVPLAALQIDNAGSIVSANGIVDLRPDRAVEQSDEAKGREPSVTRLRTISRSASDPSNDIHLMVRDAWSNPPIDSAYPSVRMSISGSEGRLSNGISIDDAAYISPAAVIAPRKWFYVYLCPFFGVAPSGGNSNQQRGVIVLSDIAPDGGRNSAALVLPAPYSNYAVSQFEAQCVGWLRRRGSLVGDPAPGSPDDCWVAMTAVNGKTSLHGDYSGLTTLLRFLTGQTGTPTIEIVSSLMPQDAERLVLYCTVDVNLGVSESNLTVSIQNASGQNMGQTDVLLPVGSGTSTVSVRVEAPCATYESIFVDFAMTGGSTGVAGNIAIALESFEV